MTKESREGDSLFGNSFVKLDTLLAFLLELAAKPRCWITTFANLLLHALPLDGFIGVLRPRWGDMISLDFEVFLLLRVCKSQSQSVRASKPEKTMGCVSN